MICFRNDVKAVVVEEVEEVVVVVVSVEVATVSVEETKMEKHLVSFLSIFLSSSCLILVAKCAKVSKFHLKFCLCRRFRWRIFSLWWRRRR